MSLRGERSSSKLTRSVGSGGRLLLARAAVAPGQGSRVVHVAAMAVWSGACEVSGQGCKASMAAEPWQAAGFAHVITPTCVSVDHLRAGGWLAG